MYKGNAPYKGRVSTEKRGQRPRFSSRPQSGPRRAPRRGPGIDVSRFINKAVITEEVEHFVPEHRFTDFDLNTKVKENISKKGYVDPTPIQDRAIPHVLLGSDVVGIANTG